jgi:hypothetical protein
MIASIINTTGATIVIGTDSFTIRRDHVSFQSIVEELNGNRDPVKLRSLLDVKEAISTLTEGKVEVKDDKLYVNGAEVNTGLARRIMTLIKDNQNGVAGPLMRFLENLMSNPSRRSVQGLYEWLEKSDLPITDDGHFIAWKIVGPTFKDLHSGTFDNSPGQVCEVQRNEVDEDPDQTCSYGLHFCSTGYLPSYGRAEGNKVVMVKVNPADVVAFPRDYNTAKGRTCRYEVLSEVDRSTCGDQFKDTPVYRAPTPVTSPITGMFTNARGAVTFMRNDGTEVPTRVPALGDYDCKPLDDGRVQLLPSGRKVNI